MTELVLSMDEPKKKLAALECYIPDHTQGLVYQFGKFLAGYLNAELVPAGFVMGCELAIHDLQKGVNGFTGEALYGKLVGYPPFMYGLLRAEIPTIADAVLPTDFAAEVRNFVEEVNAKMREERAES
jgi:hypothetical protein